MAKLRAYVMDNLDGTNSGMVAATGLKEAAKKLGTSVYHMRQYGWQYGTDEDAKVALGAPDTMFHRPIDGRSYPWKSHRWERDYEAGIGKFKPLQARAA